MSTYLASGNIKVFPASDRGDNYKLSSLTTETNLTSFIRSIYPKNDSSFVIVTGNGNVFQSPFYFVIKGYSFCITDVSGLDLDHDIYATICVSAADDTLSTYKKLLRCDGQPGILDDTAGFLGLIFDTDEPSYSESGKDFYTLKLWDGTKVPLKSRFYLTTNEIRNDSAGTKALSSEFTTDNLTVNTSAQIAGTLNVSGSSILKNPVSITTIDISSDDLDNNIVISSGNQLKKVSLQSADVTPSAETGSSSTTITYVSTIAQAANGRITRTRKTTTVSSGDTTQATFKFNGNEIKVKDLGSTDTPTFKNTTISDLSASQVVMSDANKKLASRDISQPDSATAASSSSNKVMTEKAVYHTLPSINNSHTYNSSNSIYAPTGSGTANDLLISGGSNTAPSWTSQANITAGQASKLTTDTAGSSTTPVYFANGIPAAVSSIASSLLPNPGSDGKSKGAPKMRFDSTSGILYITTNGNDA